MGIPSSGGAWVTRAGGSWYMRSSTAFSWKAPLQSAKVAYQASGTLRLCVTGMLMEQFPSLSLLAQWYVVHTSTCSGSNRRVMYVQVSSQLTVFDTIHQTATMATTTAPATSRM